MRDIILILSVFVSFKAFSYPISPATLPFLILKSSHIVIAKIENPVVNEGKNIFYDSVRKEKLQAGRDGDGIAYLNIIEVLQGKLSQKKIKVEIPSFTCPTPPEYKDGNFVMAFLNESDDSTYVTTSLAWGAKEGAAIAGRIDAYRMMTYRYLNLPRGNGEFIKNFVEFLVQCCENKYTKWDGIYSFVYQNEDPINRYDYCIYQSALHYLTDEQKKRIEYVFFENKFLTTTDFYFLQFISNANRKLAAKKILEDFQKLESDSFDLDEFMDSFIYLFPDTRLTEIADEFSSFGTLNEKQAMKNSFYQRANEVLR